MIKKDFSKKDYEVVEFTNQLHPRIQVRAMYFELGFSVHPFIFGRHAVLDGLLQALDYLPDNYGFLIWDIYRPRKVQQKIYQWMSGEIRKKFPDLSEEEHHAEVLKYVAAPSTIGESYCSPHISGGAIDLTLYDVNSGNELDMGTPFDDCTERAHSRYFDRYTQLSSEESAIKEHRDCLRRAMENVGFTAYQYEWWHFDMGTIFWANALECSTVFGPLFGDDEWPVWVGE